MLFTFLNYNDLEAAIKLEQLTQLVRDNTFLIELAETSSVSWMQDYLGQRFDLDATFPRIEAWAAGNDYGPAALIVLASESAPCQPGPLDYLQRPEPAVSGASYRPPYAYNPAGRLTNYAWHDGTYYEAITPSLGVEPGVTDNWAASWRERDPRDPKLRSFAVDVTLFNLFKRVAPARIPQLRTDMYNQAKEWLTLVRDGNLTPNLPRPLKVADSSDEIRWGSNSPRSLFY